MDDWLYQVENPCPICGNELMDEHKFDIFITGYECKVCGKYKIHDSVPKILVADRNFRNRLFVLSFFLRKKSQESGEIFFIENNEMAERIISNYPEPANPLDKIDILLMSLYGNIRRGIESNSQLHIDYWKDYPLAFCKNIDELKDIVYLAKIEGYFCSPILETDDSYVGGIDPKGWKRIRELENSREESTKVFIASWFDDSMDVVIDAMKDVLKNGLNNVDDESLLEKHFGEDFEEVLKREGEKSWKKFTGVWLKTEHFNNTIDDAIIAGIKESRFVIADLTGNRQNAYYEAGFAAGMGIPVIYTYQKQKEVKVHFDVDHFQRITWEKDNLDELKIALYNRIRASIL